MGTGTIAPTALPAAPQLQDPLAQQIATRRSALRALANRRGLASTTVANKPAAGVDPMLGITDPGATG